MRVEGLIESSDTWESNLKALRGRLCDSTLTESWRDDPPELPKGVDLIPTTSGLWTMHSFSLDGSSVLLHSEEDPMAEACLEINRELNGHSNSGVVVVAGMGLGYLALACADLVSKEVPLILVIGEPSLFWLSMRLMDWRSVLRRPNTHLVVGSEPRQVRGQLSKFLGHYGGRRMKVIKHPVLCQLRSDFYSQVFGELSHRPWWDYPRFQHDEVKVLLVSLRHLLLSEISGALQRLGHLCKVLLMAGQELDRHAVEKMFTEAIKDFQPDFVLTINHLGFDREGVVTGLLTRYKIPFASWYVDSPHLIIRHYAQNQSPYLTLFLWDKDYIEIVTKLGFNQVEYLPLGVDETLFYPIKYAENPWAHLASDVSFVGNSMVIKVRSILHRFRMNGLLRDRFAEVSAAFQQSHHQVVRDMIGELFPDLAGQFARFSEPEALAYEWAVTWQATGWYRAELVKKLRPFGPLVIGDRGWTEILGEGFRLHRELNYYSDLPAFYNVSKVSFNATSRQMKEGVNQRVFDVPACRGVVVTDWTRQLENLMEPGREVLAYRNGDEISEWVTRALQDEDFRKRVGEAGYRRVLHEHTYGHRLQSLINFMKRNSR